MQSLLLFSGWFFSLASGPPRTLAPLVLTPRQLRHRLAGLHVHQLSREHHGRRHVVVLEPVVGAVRVGVVVKILGCFVNFKLATLVLRLVRRIGSRRQRVDRCGLGLNHGHGHTGKGKHSRALGNGNGWRNFVSMVVPAQARSLTSQVIPMRVIVTAERLETFWTGDKKRVSW